MIKNKKTLRQTRINMENPCLFKKMIYTTRSLFMSFLSDLFFSHGRCMQARLLAPCNFTNNDNKSSKVD